MGGIHGHSRVAASVLAAAVMTAVARPLRTVSYNPMAANRMERRHGIQAELSSFHIIAL